jgi:glycosyltransferase involved in cell wall biosynthesis
MTRLAVVMPCYNEEAVLAETCERVTALLGRLAAAGTISTDSRVYMVDDGSRDRTWEIIRSFVDDGLPVVGIKLSRNRGHQNALLAGLFAAQGDAVVSMDADLQDDINAVDEMLARYHEGCDIVYGVRGRRSSDSTLKRFTAKTFYRLMNALGAQAVYNHADYRLMSRRAIDALREYREVNLFLRGIIPLIGFRSATVHYDRGPRFAGESKYPVRKMVEFALDAITSFSVVPLRMITVIGFLVFFFSTVMSGYVLWTRLFTDIAVPGWASTVLPVYFLGGIQIFCVGMIGEYMGKLYAESKARPRFIIEEVLTGRTAASGSAARRKQEAAPAHVGER